MVYNFQQGMMAGASGAGGYQIDQSILFNDDDSAYLTKTFSTDEGDTWTLSLWMKRGDISTGNQYFFSEAGGSGIAFVGSSSTPQYALRLYNGATIYNSTPLYRDPSAWYHFVFSNNAGTWVCYVNGELVSGFTGTAANFNRNNAWSIGQYQSGGGNYFDGYLADIYWIGDQALSPTSFGETNVNGVWVPKAYAGTYGTNGFYITGADSADLGADYSGNGNDFTSSGLTTTDQVTDTPTNNHATLSPLIPTTSAGVFSNGNLSVYPVANVGSNQWFSTIGVSSGKWHVEAVCGRFGNNTHGYAVGIASTLNGTANHGSASFGQLMYDSGSGNIADATDGSVAVYAYGDTFTVGDRITCEFDLDGNSIEFFKNGASQGTYTPDGDISNGDTYFAVCGDRTDVISVGYDWTFNADNFTDTPTAGFEALSTANLPEPTIKDGSKYFQTTLYTGNGTAIGSGGNAVTQSENSTFQPDFVWMKSRSAATDHALYDAVRGTTKEVISNSTAIESTLTEGLTTFGAAGFTVGSDAAVNTNVATYAAWQWKANGAGVSNTDGTISSTVSAAEAGHFGIAAYTGTGAAATVGHGMGGAPEMIIVKSLTSGAANWHVGHKNLTSWAYRLLLDTSGAQVLDSSAWNSTAPTSTVFSIANSGGTNVSSGTHIAYCFRSVPGFSKLGSYTGNGSANGPFVYCGFRPNLIMLKSTVAAQNWQIIDTARDTYNAALNPVQPNLSAAEAALGAGIDILSNGFKLRNTTAPGFGNTSAGTYIFMAFAEHPFGGDGVAPVPAR
jgi:hypothetical protein